MMKIIHKKTMLMWVLSLCSISGAFAQTLGFNYQAIIKADPSNSFEFYGETVSLNFLASSDVALRFTIVNALGQSDYIEEHYTSTNALGEVNLTVGSGRASQGTFQAIVWDGTQKQLSVEIDYTATGSAYQFSNTQDLLYLPHPINTSSSTFIADLRDSISDIRFDLTQNQTESKSTDQGLQYTMDLLRDDVATNKSDISSLQTAQTTQNSAEESAAITAVQDDVDANEAAANTAIALKEDAANKSTDGTLADDTDTKFPTEKAVKTYVDAQVESLTTDDDITGATIDGASLLTISEGTTEITVDLSALEESAAITAVQDDVDQNKSDADAAIALKEDVANKSTDVNLADDTDTKFPTEKAVKTYVDTKITTVSTQKDDVFTLQDEGDATKQAKFELSGIAAANTRTLTLPDADGTIALTTDLAGDFTAATSLGAGTSGLVPAPTTEADNAKFLKGDGTWAEVLTTVTANNVNLQTAVDIDADGSDETTVEAAITKLIATLTAATAPVVDGSTPIEFIYGETKEVTVTGNLIRPNHTLSNTGGFSSVYKSDSWSDSEITFNVTAPYEAVTEAPQNLSGSTQTINFSTLSPRLNATHNEVFIKGATRTVTFEGSNFHDQMELTGLPEGYVVTSGYVCCNNTSVVFNVTAPTTASPQTTVTLSDNLGTGSITFETMALEVGTPYGGGVIVWLNPNNPGHGYIMKNADEGKFKYGGYQYDNNPVRPVYLDAHGTGKENSEKIRNSYDHGNRSDELGALLNRSVNAGWWVPSRSEWDDILSEKEAINQAAPEGFQVLSGVYWTSSEVSDNSVYINYAKVTRSGASDEPKNSMYNVRLVKEF